jgi:hypothetical protein
MDAGCAKRPQTDYHFISSDTVGQKKKIRNFGIRYETKYLIPRFSSRVLLMAKSTNIFLYTRILKYCIPGDSQ